MSVELFSLSQSWFNLINAVVSVGQSVLFVTANHCCSRLKLVSE